MRNLFGSTDGRRLYCRRPRRRDPDAGIKRAAKEKLLVAATKSPELEGHLFGRCMGIEMPGSDPGNNHRTRNRLASWRR